MSNRLTAISITFLGVCVLVGSWILSTSLRANAKAPVTATMASVHTYQLLTQNELEQYLGISNSDLQKLMHQTNVPTESSQIPSMKIGNKYYFSLPAINNWLKVNPSGIYN